MNSASGYRRPDHSCKECGLVFDRPAKLRDHQRKHTGERPFQCATCNAAFAKKKDLDSHQLSHTPSTEKPYKCPKCDKGVNTLQHLEVHMHVHRQLVCELCQRTFVRQKVFEKHRASHAKCEDCDKLFRNRIDLGTHIFRQHQCNYKCADCGETFPNNQRLTWHVKRHQRTREKFLKDVKKNVALNVRTLTGLEYSQRPFSCDWTGCNHRFTREYDLLRHLKKGHDVDVDGNH